MKRDKQTKKESTKEEVKREDFLTDDRKVDLKKKPKNNDKVKRMSRRFLYEKTGNYVVYARMLQLKRVPANYLEGDVIKTKK